MPLFVGASAIDLLAFKMIIKKEVVEGKGQGPLDSCSYRPLPYILWELKGVMSHLLSEVNVTLKP
jgi:hypothetical protein